MQPAFTMKLCQWCLHSMHTHLTQLCETNDALHTVKKFSSSLQTNLRVWTRRANMLAMPSWHPSRHLHHDMHLPAQLSEESASNAQRSRSIDLVSCSANAGLLHASWQPQRLYSAQSPCLLKTQTKGMYAHLSAIQHLVTTGVCWPHMHR